MSILSEILATKHTEIARKSEQIPLGIMQERLVDAPPVRNFTQALRIENGPALIAEVKKASPSKGIIRANFDPLEIATAYSEGGANCLSVLTDETYFMGHTDYVTRIRQIVDLPILRKDFIIDPWQILESRILGADALLLIVAALPPKDLRKLMDTTHTFGMQALVEVHNESELHEALDAGATLIGINNRDLHTFCTSLNVTINIMKSLPHRDDLTIVSESGIFTYKDLIMLRDAGVGAVLVGESLMREEDVVKGTRKLLGTLN